ncbi:MAG: TonB-dependent receptor [gamma proteobacterium symbiont of Bathyaustriella thionipta]|nr:TonB-dependent receptor [gamma proteobacterium symbiont of Bathyaustriella thionipta]
MVLPAISPSLQAAPAAQEQDDALLTLVNLMDTDIAVKTDWLGADDSPGQVTVLSGEEIIARGYRTVGEAVTLIPGVDMSISKVGANTPIVRGAGGSRVDISGKLKLLIDGVAVNSALTGNGAGYWDIPVEQIERIEFIRGPGSAVYGEFALSGVVNLVMRKVGKGAFVRYDSEIDAWTGGAVFSFAHDSGMNASLNLAGWDADKGNVTAGPDALFNSPITQPFSSAPGPTNESRENQSAAFNFTFQDFSFSANYLQQKHGDYFGVNDILPPPSDRKIVTNRTWLAEARQLVHFSDQLNSKFIAGYRAYTNDLDDILILPPPPFPAPPPGYLANVHYEENEYYAKADTTWTGFQQQTILMALEYSRIKMQDVSASTPLVDNRSRNHFSVVLQDQARISDQLSLTGGLRYDRYSDVDDSLTPRLAAVYQLSASHLIKAQYAEAFRPPTFGELYSTLGGSTDIKPETQRSLELSYIYRIPDSVLRFTLFHTQMEDMIEEPAIGIFRNAGDATLQGAEFEWDLQLNRQWKVDGNLSYSDTESDESHQQLEGSINWLANVGLMYQPQHDWAFSAQYRYVGERNREASDTRSDLSGQHTIDLSANLFNAGMRGLTLRAGVRNLLDEDLVEPAPANTYADDFPRPGRSVWGQISYDL